MRAYITAVQAEVKEQKNLMNQKKESDRKQVEAAVIRKKMDEVLALTKKLESQSSVQCSQSANHISTFL